MKNPKLIFLLILVFWSQSQVDCNPVPASTSAFSLNNLKNWYKDFFRSSDSTNPTDGACIPKHLLTSSISELHQARLDCSKRWRAFHKALTQSNEADRTSAALLRQLALECPKSEKNCQEIMRYKDQSADFAHDIGKLIGVYNEFDLAATKITASTKKSLESADLQCSIEDGKIHPFSKDQPNIETPSLFENVYIAKAICTEAQLVSKLTNETISKSQAVAERIGSHIGHAVMFMTLTVPELEEIARKDSNLPVEVLEKFKKSVDNQQNSLKDFLATVSDAAAQECDLFEVKLEKFVKVLCGRAKELQNKI